MTSLLALVISGVEPETVRFEKQVLDKRFVSEGVAVADVNRDRKLDIIAGNVWYEGPQWKPHEIAPYVEVDPKKAWSNCFNTWAADLNWDGWPDQILIGMPGDKAVWRENPKGGPGPWKVHPIWRGAGNESPLYVDLFRNDKKVLVMAYDDTYLAWLEPDKDPYKEWVCHNVSGPKGAGSHRFSHGLGVADLDGDRKNEILTTKGYYRQENGGWTFIAGDLGPDCAQMLSLGAKKGILSTSAHNRGVWLHEPLADGGWKRTVIDETISVTHAANLTKLGKSNVPNLITGKRKWGHPPGVDPGSEEPHWLVRYELSDGKWARHIIDEDSGVGTQFVVQDLNKDGLDDIVTANKNGVFLFVQIR